MVESSACTSALLETLADGFISLDHELRFIYVNASASRYLSSPGALIGSDSVPFLAELFAACLVDHLEHVLQHQKPANCEIYSSSLGQAFAFRMQPTTDGVSALFFPTTAPAPSDHLRSRLAAVVESSQDAIITLDLDTTITSWNRAAERIFGFTAAEAIGKPITILIPKGHEEEEPRIIARLLKGERVEHFETVRKRRDGTLVDVSLTVSPIYDSAGSVIGASKISRDITRNRENETLHRRLAAIVESSRDAIIGLNLDTTVTTWNRAAERMFGYSAAEIVGKSVVALIPPGLEDEEPRILERLIKGERVEHYHTVRRRKDGSLLDVSLTVSPIHDHAGKVIGASKISRDITQVKRQQEALRRSEEELRALANSIPQLAWMARPDGYVFWYNQRWFDYTGTTLEEMEGWGWKCVHDPQYLRPVEARWRRCIQEGLSFEMEFPLRGADGVFRWFLTRVNPFRDSTGAIIRWFGTNTEVDELRRTQQALREETRTLELLNQTGRCIASQLDLENILRTVTDSATNLSGADFGAFIYNNAGDANDGLALFTSAEAQAAFLPLRRHLCAKLLAPTFRGEPPVRCDDLFRDGRFSELLPGPGNTLNFPIRSYLAVPVISRSGEVIGGLFFGHPETARFSARSEHLAAGIAAQAAIAIDNARLFGALRQAREQLRHQNETLEAQVEQRTAQLWETIQELEAFSYSVSHDMRAPLRAMQGYADALLEDYKGRFDPTADQYLTRIHKAARRMDLLIQDVLAYSRVAKGDVLLAPVRMESIIADVVQNYPALQPERAEITIQTAIPPVIGHEAYLTQIVSNLLGNAVKFVEPGTFPKVAISAIVSGGIVRIAFRDNGIGIEPRQEKHIFQIFGRVHADKRFEGTGIGLAIVKKAAERMGGSVGVVSQPGYGSEFFVLLKRA